MYGSTPPGLVSLFQIWDFCGYSLNTPKYPKMGIICYFFLCKLPGDKLLPALLFSISANGIGRGKKKKIKTKKNSNVIQSNLF